MATADDRNNQCAVCGCYSTAVTKLQAENADLKRQLLTQADSIRHGIRERTACAEHHPRLASGELLVEGMQYFEYAGLEGIREATFSWDDYLCCEPENWYSTREAVEAKSQQD